MKIRIRFRKYGVMKFIGHLDVMRYFQKAMRRAHIDICYSEGFSPHQIMSFAAPLGVGITSDGEYMDIEVHTSASTEESLRALNGVMVEGVECTEATVLDGTYAIQRPFVFATKTDGTLSEAAQAFFDFAMDPANAELYVAAGVVPANS